MFVPLQRGGGGEVYNAVLLQHMKNLQHVVYVGETTRVAIEKNDSLDYTLLKTKGDSCPKQVKHARVDGTWPDWIVLHTEGIACYVSTKSWMMKSGMRSSDEYYE